MEIMKKLVTLKEKDLTGISRILSVFYRWLVWYHGKKVRDEGIDVHTEKYIKYSTKLIKLKKLKSDQ